MNKTPSEKTRTVHFFSPKNFARGAMVLGSSLILAWWLLMSTAHSQTSSSNADIKSLIIAGGCFWCLEHDFDKIPGVVATTSGYSGGHVENPSYKDVTRGDTGQYEVVKIDYDPSLVRFDDLLTAFWHSTDPTDPGGQFCDRGMSYSTAVFVDSIAERTAAEASREALRAQGYDIVTPILDRVAFYPAEGYHQDYAQRNQTKYSFYPFTCGRNSGVRQVWGDWAYNGIPK